MPWLVLILSGVLEAVWATALSRSEGFTRVGPSVLFGVSLALSMGGLAIALRTLPVGVAYAVWTGVGASLTAIVAVALFDEPMSVLKIVSLVLIVAGIVGLNLSES